MVGLTFASLIALVALFVSLTVKAADLMTAYLVGTRTSDGVVAAPTLAAASNDDLPRLNAAA